MQDIYFTKLSHISDGECSGTLALIAASYVFLLHTKPSYTVIICNFKSYSYFRLYSLNNAKIALHFLPCVLKFRYIIYSWNTLQDMSENHLLAYLPLFEPQNRFYKVLLFRNE